MPKIAVAKNGDVTPGAVRVVEAGGKRIALCNHDGTFYAIDDVCTHDRGPLGEGELIGWEVECPRHGARFDVRTGQATRLPAIMPVKTYPVTADGDEISVEVPE